MYASPLLVPVRIGILPHGIGVEGDHRNMYADFHNTTFLGDELHAIPPPPRAQRRLQLFDSRIVARFNRQCLKHIQANKIQTQLDNLIATATHPPSPEIQQ